MTMLGAGSQEIFDEEDDQLVMVSDHGAAATRADRDVGPSVGRIRDVMERDSTSKHGGMRSFFFLDFAIRLMSI